MLLPLQSFITFGLASFFAVGLYVTVELYFFPLFLRPYLSHDVQDQANLHHPESASEVFFDCEE